MRRSTIAVFAAIALAVGGCGSQVQYATVDLVPETVAHMPVEAPSPELRSYFGADPIPAPLIAVGVVLLALTAAFGGGGQL